MTALPQDNATEDTRALALEMFRGNVPCVMSMGDPPCPETAAYIAYFVHLADTDCEGQTPVPLCPEHRRALESASHPFWRAWANADPATCDICGSEVAVDRFEAIT